MRPACSEDRHGNPAHDRAVRCSPHWERLRFPAATQMASQARKRLAADVRLRAN
jgi:hypothetical protein